MAGPIYGPWAYESVPNSYCLQGRIWGYPGNCQFSSYAQCMATASGTLRLLRDQPPNAFALQGRGDYRPRILSGSRAEQLGKQLRRRYQRQQQRQGQTRLAADRAEAELDRVLGER